jgi:acetylornithine/N-succinyldiaminopimelate aminotransferase
MVTAASSPLLPIYRRSNILMVRGEGAYLYDDTGKEYLDFASGIATNALGHGHPAMLAALHGQADQLWHCSNLFRNQPLEDFAALLAANSFAEKIFFCSSGTEAVEAAIKTLRRYHFVRGDVQRTDIIAVDGAFHGRTTGALAACSNPASQEGFRPLMGGVTHAPFHDIAALEAAITDNTAGVLLETIQGEGGVREHSAEYLQAVRKICDAHGILLFLDEIQCGYGRTGSLFAYEQAGITPDIVTCAKGMGGGFPLAAMLTTNRASEGMTAGTHGSTYGSNPLACAVGLAVLQEMLKPDFLPHVMRMGEMLRAELQGLVDDFPATFTQARGRGLMLALALTESTDKYALSARLRDAGLIVAPAVAHVLRILPPLIITQKHITQAMTILRSALK